MSGTEDLQGTGGLAAEAPDPPKEFKRIPFRRRRYLIDRKGQLLATAKVAGVVFVLLLLLNVVFSLWNTIETQSMVASNPELSEQMESIDRKGTLALGIVSSVVLVIVVIRSIMLTHRTAGAAFNLHRCLDRVASGDYSTVLRVRRKDNLRDLVDPFNNLVSSLRNRASEDETALRKFADRVEELGNRELAGELRLLADAKKDLVEPS
jgi:methyl-accepting chemotaxis protein